MSSYRQKLWQQDGNQLQNDSLVTGHPSSILWVVRIVLMVWICLIQPINKHVSISNIRTIWHALNAFFLLGVSGSPTCLWYGKWSLRFYRVTHLTLTRTRLLSLLWYLVILLQGNEESLATHEAPHGDNPALWFLMWREEEAFL